MGIAKELIDRFFFFFLKKQGFFSGKGIFLWGLYVRWRFFFLFEETRFFFCSREGNFFMGFVCAVALIGFGILKRGMRKYGCKCGGWG